MAPVLDALADPTRWDILCRLGEEPASASALARELPVSRQAIAKHLEVLELVGLVQSSRSGRELRFRACGGPLSHIGRELDRIGSGWEARLLHIKRLAEGHQHSVENN